MTTTAWTVLVVAALVIVAIALLGLRARRTKRLRSQFGPEYDHLVQERGNTTRAERELDRRAQRVEKFHVHPLTREQCDSFASQWRTIQQRFVDDPKGSVAEADILVQGTMKARGYPMGDFEERAADLSVDHPRVIENYRNAHEIALRDSRNTASTEDLRIALRHYRMLFEELLDVHNVPFEEVKQ